MAKRLRKIAETPAANYRADRRNAILRDPERKGKNRLRWPAPQRAYIGHSNSSNTYKPNGKRECARRMA